MKKPGIWSVCFLAVLPLVLAGPTCTCPIKRLLAPDKVQSAPAEQPKSAAHRPTERSAAESPAPDSFAEAVDRARALKKPIYLEFSANWCIPCRLYEKNVLTSNQGKEVLKSVVFYHVNVDKDRGLTDRFHVTAVPTGFLLKPGTRGSEVKVLNRHTGALSAAELRGFLGQGS
jgi:thiol:disulfide interchange protein